VSGRSASVPGCFVPDREELDPAVTRRAEELLERYRERHARILDPSDASVPKQFVVFPEHRPWHGLGNNQITFLYEFLVGLLTGRALIGEPFPGAERYYDLPIRAGHADLRAALGLDLTAVPEYVEQVARLGQAEYYPGWAAPEAMACADYTDLSVARYLSLDEGRVKVYRYSAGIPHVVFAGINPHHREFLRRHFGRHLFYYLARFLFRPGPRTLAAVEPYRERLSGGFAVGVHLRYGRGPLDLYCWNSRSTRLFWERVETVLDQHRERKPVVFLATDSMKARAEASARFGDKIVHLSAAAAPDGDTFSAVVDQYLLTQCDALIVTNRSTFGYFAHAVAGIAPHVVDGKLGRVTKLEDSQSGVYKRGRWEVESIWPWQWKALARCSCQDRWTAAEIGPRGGTRPGDIVRWLWRVELPGWIQRAWGWLAWNPRSPARLLLPRSARRILKRMILGRP
jgi:hypothetical protein